MRLFTLAITLPLAAFTAPSDRDGEERAEGRREEKLRDFSARCVRRTAHTEVIYWLASVSIGLWSAREVATDRAINA
jgi:hypothetical protein